MEIVIKIPDAMYKTVLDGTYCGSLYDELKNGTVLPKGHGRIIDEDKIEWEPIWDESVPEHKSCVGYTAYTDKAPTLVEADKED